MNFSREFVPKPFYEAAADSLILCDRNERSYAKRINDQFSLFFAMSDDSFAGIEFNGLAADFDGLHYVFQGSSYWGSCPGWEPIHRRRGAVKSSQSYSE